MNHVQLLNDTLKFYGDDTSRRATTSSGVCQYLAPNGNQCAFGRLVLPDKYDRGFEGDSASILLDSYRGFFPNWVYLLNREWCDRVQRFHDSAQFWGPEKGLTPAGQSFFDSLMASAMEFDAAA